MLINKGLLPFKEIKQDNVQRLKPYELMADKKINRATLRSLHELEKVLAKFGKHWEAWSKSNYCVLSAKEVAIINHYREYKTHLAYAEPHNLARRHVSVIYNKSTRKLKMPRTTYLFNKWLVYSDLSAAGTAEKNIDLESMVEPVKHLLMPADLLLKIDKAIVNNEPTSLTTNELKRSKSFVDLTSGEKHQLRRSNLCVYMYIIPTVDENGEI